MTAQSVGPAVHGGYLAIWPTGPAGSRSKTRWVPPVMGRPWLESFFEPHHLSMCMDAHGTYTAVPRTVATKEKKCSPQVIETATVRQQRLIRMGTSHNIHMNRPVRSAGWLSWPRLTQGQLCIPAPPGKCLPRLARFCIRLPSCGRVGDRADHLFHVLPDCSREAVGCR